MATWWAMRGWRVAAALVVGVLAIGACGPGGPAPDTAIYVDPVSGNDAQSGTAAAPLRTLTAALGRATDGGVIRLAAGTYVAANGEAWPRHGGFPPVSATNVPSGVTIVGVGAGTVRGARRTPLPSSSRATRRFASCA